MRQCKADIVPKMPITMGVVIVVKTVSLHLE